MKKLMIMCCILSAAIAAGCDDLVEAENELVIAGGEKINISTSLSEQEIEKLILSGDGYWAMEQSFTYKSDSKGIITKIGSDYCNFTPPTQLEGYGRAYLYMAFNGDGTVDLYQHRSSIVGPFSIVKTVCSYAIHGNSVVITHLTDKCQRQDSHEVTEFTLKVVGISDDTLVLEGELWRELTHNFDTFKVYANRRSVFAKKGPLNNLLKEADRGVVESC